MVQRLLIFIILTIHLDSLRAAPEIQLPLGVIRGFEATTIENKTYYAFKKIPYAAPPIGELRFKAPIPPSSWDEPLDTLDFDVSCYQQSAEVAKETEDCLYLSVFTPQLPTEDNNPDLATMVFIHGGGFVGGTGRHTYSERIVNQDVIFIAINYRLGPFGFLSTEDEVIPGNNGLKDQHLALKWIHDNIQFFGGDPNKITIFGQSAGSASVAYQLLNPESEGLFRGALLQSGTFLCPWAYQRNAREIAFTTAAFLNDTFKTNRNSNDLLKFLLTVEGADLDAASVQYNEFESSPEDTEILQGFYWAPVIEVENPDAFITKKMYELFEGGNVVRVPVLIGMTSEEYLAFSQHKDELTSSMEAYDQNLGWLVPNDMKITDEATRTEIGSKIREIYTGGEPFADHLGDGVRYGSDTSFTRPIIKHAEFYSQFAETYFYLLSYDGELGHFKTHYEGAEDVAHNQQKKYIFCSGTSCDVSSYPESDQITVQRIITIWTNFAKYQNPTPEPSELLQNITWPLVSIEDGDFLYVDIGENLEIKNHPKEETYQKWTELYDSLGYNDFDTY